MAGGGGGPLVHMEHANNNNNNIIRIAHMRRLAWAQPHTHTYTSATAFSSDAARRNVTRKFHTNMRFTIRIFISTTHACVEDAEIVRQSARAHTHTPPNTNLRYCLRQFCDVRRVSVSPMAAATGCAHSSEPPVRATTHTHATI